MDSNTLVVLEYLRLFASRQLDKAFELLDDDSGYGSGSARS